MRTNRFTKHFGSINGYFLSRLSLFTALLLLSVCDALGQAEVQSWGNITGIRKHDQLFDFESCITLITRDGKFFATGKERQHPHYKRTGDDQQVTTNIDSLFIRETVNDKNDGEAKINLQLSAHADNAFKGLYFCILLPRQYANGRFKSVNGKFVCENKNGAAGRNHDDVSNGAEFTTSTSKLEIKFEEPTKIMVRKDTTKGKNQVQLYVELKAGGVVKDELINKAYTIKVSGVIDESPVELTLNTAQSGSMFTGLGGNFRLQNPKTDMQVVDYSLNNLRVAWGRVELPWRYWQPDKKIDPILQADSGKINPEVKKAMLMAHRLDSLGIPLILSAWAAPKWAVIGEPHYGAVNGIWGNPLNKKSMDTIYRSITNYIIYLKNKYGTEVKLFSFNEADLGVNVRLTPQEHDELIKGLGAYFAAHGVHTKMLLGDNSDALSYNFIVPAMKDPAARPYIGAVAFHSWRGWDYPTLTKWGLAAKKLKVPLMVSEGSVDAAAYDYPDIFKEKYYAMQEMNLYVRLLAACQPASILQWQLTADYSPLIGGGIFGNNELLHPGQRFWNLKQFSSTPKDLYAMPVDCNKSNITCAALGNNNSDTYAIHLVNNGTKRGVNLQGLPAGVKELVMYTTNEKLNMQPDAPITVKNGKAKFKIPAGSYITLISK